MENVANAGFSGMMIDPTDLTNDGLSPWWILCVFKCVAFLLNAPLCKDCTNTTHTHTHVRTQLYYALHTVFVTHAHFLGVFFCFTIHYTHSLTHGTRATSNGATTPNEQWLQQKKNAYTSHKEATLDFSYLAPVCSRTQCG